MNDKQKELVRRLRAHADIEDLHHAEDLNVAAGFIEGATGRRLRRARFDLLEFIAAFFMRELGSEPLINTTIVGSTLTITAVATDLVLQLDLDLR